MSRSCGLPRESFIALSIAVFYGFSSLSLGLLNKALLSSYAFNGIFLLLAVQMVLQLVCCAVTRD
jgi:hypothetical protein